MAGRGRCRPFLADDAVGDCSVHLTAPAVLRLIHGSQLRRCPSLSVTEMARRDLAIARVQIQAEVWPARASLARGPSRDRGTLRKGTLLPARP